MRFHGHNHGNDNTLVGFSGDITTIQPLAGRNAPPSLVQWICVKINENHRTSTRNWLVFTIE